MPFNRPALTALVERIGADLEARLPGADASQRRTALGVISRVLAGSVHGLYGYLDELALQLLPDTADSEHLDRHAAIWGEPRKAAATAAGNVSFSGADGGSIPAGTLLQSAAGVEYLTQADAVIAAGSATVAVKAALAGAAGNLAAASALALTVPLDQVNSAAVVAAGGLAGGSDSEGDDSLRVRVLKRIRQPPHGGTAFDYELWALEVADVTRAWVLPGHLGAGTVGVAFVCDQLTPILPDAAKVQQVQDYLETKRPVTAAVTAFAPVAVAVNFTIALIPNTATVQAAVAAELADLLIREAQPDDGNGSGTILLSHIREAISTAAGETDHVLVAPVADVILATGQMATLGVITWQ